LPSSRRPRGDAAAEAQGIFLAVIVVKFAGALSVRTRHSPSRNIVLDHPMVRIAGAIWAASQTNEVM
jgi:hypothetical protein